MAIKHSFGHLKGQFRSILKTLDMERIDLIPKFILACCVLHNICSIKNDAFPDVYEAPSLEENERIRGDLVIINREGAMKRDNICVPIRTV